MSKVYVIQNQLMRDRKTGEMRPKFNLSAAEDYGELVFLLDSSSVPFYSPSIISQLQEKLKDYKPEDSLLLIGNPCFIGWAVALAAKSTNGLVRMLQWHNQSESYILIEGDLSNG